MGATGQFDELHPKGIEVNIHADPDTNFRLQKKSSNIRNQWFAQGVTNVVQYKLQFQINLNFRGCCYHSAPCYLVDVILISPD